MLWQIAALVSGHGRVSRDRLRSVQGWPGPQDRSDNSSLSGTEREEAQPQHKHGEAARRASGKPAMQTLGLAAIYLARILGIVAFCVAMELYMRACVCVCFTSV